MIDKTTYKRAAEISKTNPSRAYDMIEKTVKAALGVTQKELKQIFKSHQQYMQRGSKYGDCADLRGANLQGLDFRGFAVTGVGFDNANLSGANLSRLYIIDSSFEGANLSQANFSGSALGGSSLKGANLKGANLSHTLLSDADFTGANLTVADFSSANLADAYFFRADLTDADLRTAKYTNLARFNNAILTGTVLDPSLETSE